MATTEEQIIHPDLLYGLPAAMAASGLGRGAMREARRNGLRVHYLSKRAFIRGADLIAYIEEHSTETKPGF